jgi:hypothetical protein
MKFERYVPRGRLSRHVRFLWASEQPPQQHSQERLLPTGEMGLFIDVSDTSSSPPILAGASSRPRVLNTAQSISMVGVSFAPGGASSLFRTPVSEIANLTVPLDELCGRSALALRAEILEAATNSARFRVLEGYLEARLAAIDAPGHPAVRYALGELRSVREVRIVDLVGCMGIGQRRFIELFRREVGLTPKLYQRVARFQRVLASIENHGDVAWSRQPSICDIDRAETMWRFRFPATAIFYNRPHARFVTIRVSDISRAPWSPTAQHLQPPLFRSSFMTT